MPDEQVPNPAAPGSPQGTPPAAGSGAGETVEDLRSRLSGAISALDKTRNEFNQFKVQAQTKETELQSQVAKLKSDLTGSMEARTQFEKVIQELTAKSETTSAELARWNFVAQKPELLDFRNILPVTTDAARLEQAGKEMAEALQKRDQRTVLKLQNAPPPPGMPAAPKSEEELRHAMALAAVNKDSAGFEKALAEWNAFQRSKSAGKQP